MRKRVYILGIIVGIIAPVVGVFFGLQASPILGNILAAPLILLTLITGTPFGMMPIWMKLLSLPISIVIWTAIFALIDKLLQKNK